MKKKLIAVAIVLVVLGIAAVVAIGMSLDKIIKQAVEKAGPAITKVDVKLDAVNLSLLSGEGALHGFSLGNPDGYKSPTSIEFGLASLSLQPSSLMADKVVIRHIRLDAPVITFEGGLRGNNLSDLVEGMKSGETKPEDDSAEPEDDEADEATSRKLQVDEFSLTGATLHTIIKELDGETNTFVLPDIILTDLGTGPEGITASELSSLVLVAITKKALQTVIESDGSLEKMGEAALRSLNESGNEDTEKTIRGVMDMFNKKKE